MFFQANLVTDEKYVRCLNLIFMRLSGEAEMDGSISSIQIRSLKVEVKAQ